MKTRAKRQMLAAASSICLSASLSSESKLRMYTAKRGAGFLEVEMKLFNGLQPLLLSVI
jgi:hypothetical protein